MSIQSIADIQVTPEAFDYIPVEFRAKVLKDLLEHLTPDQKWDFGSFNPLNDYQRHLHALFLRLSGVKRNMVAARLFAISTDVELPRRTNYVSDVIHSVIVGFPKKNGGLIPIPNQEITEE